MIDYRQVSLLKKQDDRPQVSEERLTRLYMRAESARLDPHRVTGRQEDWDRTDAIAELVDLETRVAPFGAQARVARNLGVSRQVVSRHVTKRARRMEGERLIAGVRAHVVSIDDPRVPKLKWRLVSAETGRVAAKLAYGSPVELFASEIETDFWVVTAVATCKTCGLTEDFEVSGKEPIKYLERWAATECADQ